jgi:hypothetical protein
MGIGLTRPKARQKEGPAETTATNEKAPEIRGLNCNNRLPRLEELARIEGHAIAPDFVMHMRTG